MKATKNLLAFIASKLRAAVTNDILRRNFIFRWLNIILAFVSFVMAIVNIFTHEWILMIVVLVFSVFCLINAFASFVSKTENKIFYLIFAVESMALLSFFFISGIPNGFSALWICLIPSFALLVFGRKSGFAFCCVAFVLMVFLFWIPFGRSLLQFQYTNEFMLRFPLLYIAIFFVSFLIEYIRNETQKQLYLAEQKYRHLYRHDALTTLYNRYGFNEKIDSIFEAKEHKSVALMIIDLDDFKNINDQYGHDSGDYVLKSVAMIIKKSVCEHCCYCRWGGEEFTVFLPCEHDPIETSERIRCNVEDAVFEVNGFSIKLTLSIGLCIVKDMSKVSIAQFVNVADKSLYKAKERGKNIVYISEI